MNVFNKLLLSAVPMLFLAACGTTGTTEMDTAVTEPVVEETQEAPIAIEQPTVAVVTPVEVVAGFDGHPLDDPDSLLSQRVVYFDFDKSDISDQARDIIAAHAGYLSDHPGASITLEGHADERGSREYNMGLGERRANAVRQVMMLQGASASQIEVISYGEERPAAFGHDEASWALNRRAEILYKRR